MKKIVLKLEVFDDKIKQKVMKKVSELQGVESIAIDKEKKLLTVTGNIDPVSLVGKLRKLCNTDIVSVGPKDGEKKGDNNNKKGDDDNKKGNDGKKKGGGGAQAAVGQPLFYYPAAAAPYPYQYDNQHQYPSPSVPPAYYNSYRAVDDSSNGCVIS